MEFWCGIRGRFLKEEAPPSKAAVLAEWRVKGEAMVGGEISTKEIQTQQRIKPRFEVETGAKNGVLQNYIRAEEQNT